MISQIKLMLTFLPITRSYETKRHSIPKAIIFLMSARYENVEKSHITDIDDAVKRHYYLKGEALGVSDLAIEYLDSIVSLAKAKDITLIMVSNPVHEQYLNKIPDPIMQKFDALIERYSDQHLVFDKTRSPYPDTLYLNADHLNESGAKRFTLEFIDYLKTIREN